MIDARGYGCPMPVVMTQKELKANRPDTLEVLVDNTYAAENVTRFANSCGYRVSMREEGQDYLLTLTK